jgi:O-antigen biosynthesis protein
MSLGREQLRAFPWATLGRRETPEEFVKKWREQRSRVPLLKENPLFSIVVPLPRDISLEKFSLCLDSLLSQSYPNWEAIFVAAVGVRAARSLVQAEKDSRLRWVEAPGAHSDAALKREGRLSAKGEWVGVLLPEDVLSPVALYRIVLENIAHPKSDVFYTNEATFDDSLTVTNGFITKPEMSWFNLIHFNSIGRFWVIRRKVMEAVGGLREEVGEGHEHDLFLRLYENKSEFSLVPYFLYYRREAKPRKPFSVKHIVEQHLARTQVPSTVILRDNRIKVTPQVKDLSSQLVTVVICFRDRSDWTSQALKAICAQAGKAPIEILLVNNQSRPEELAQIKRAADSVPQSTKIIDYNQPFNFANMHNLAIREHAKGRLLLFLNNDVFWSGSHSLDELVSWVVQPWVGTVGICLRYPHGGLQHGGLCALYGGQARLVRIGNQQREDAFTSESHEVFGNTFAACMARREVYDRIGGLRELEFANGFGDVIFNFECLRLGLKNIYLGHIQAIHRESASRGIDYEYWEEFGLEREFPDLLQKMLRFDLGYDRVPGGDFPFPTLFREALSRTFNERLPWLAPLKPTLKKWMRGVH